MHTPHHRHPPEHSQLSLLFARTTTVTQSSRDGKKAATVRVQCQAYTQIGYLLHGIEERHWP